MVMTEEIIKSSADCLVECIDNYDFTIGKFLNILNKFPKNMKLCFNIDEADYEMPYDKFTIEINPT
jgi:hypothetical protein